jgi:flagellar biosynthesis GTPase FlhF
MEIPEASDVNDAIRKLFYTLKNDAERAGAEQIIEENEKNIKSNKVKIDELPAEKEKFMKDLQEKYSHQKEVIANKQEIVNVQLENLEIPQPRFKWEEHGDWIKHQKTNLRLGLKSLGFESEDLDRKKDLIMEDEKQAENYEILRTRLIQQNERLRGEIDRFKGIIALCDRLDIDRGVKKPAPYIG